MWAEFAKKKLGQPVVVVNKTGGGGLTGSLFAAKAKPDGYTLFLAQAGPNIIIPLTAKGANYSFDSFDYIARIMVANCAVVVNKDAPWNNLKEFEAAAKKEPGKLVFASPAATSWLTFAMRNWFTGTGVQVKQVEYKSGGEAATAVLGGHADMTFLFPQNYAPMASADKLKILAVGLSVFFLSGVACLFARSMMWLIVISCILGIGAGMVIPFSTGLVVDYFTGDYRVRQLGYSSSINNLTLVLATVVTGYLANVDWHLPFLVYTLPGISLALSFLLKRQRSFPEPEQSIQLRHKMIDRRKLAGLMAFYFFVTYAVLVVTFYASFLIDDYKIDNSFSGVLISLFFLAIMLPGLFIDKIIRSLKRNVNLVALVLVCVGLLCVGVFHGKAMLAFGALCTGLGYGIMQPVIYDKAATIAPPRSATLALSFVMSVNYLAVMVCPFIVDLFRHVFGTHSDRFPFFFNAALVLAVAVVTLLRRGSFTLGLDESYYRN